MNERDSYRPLDANSGIDRYTGYKKQREATQELIDNDSLKKSISLIDELAKKVSNITTRNDLTGAQIRALNKLLAQMELLEKAGQKQLDQIKNRTEVVKYYEELAKIKKATDEMMLSIDNNMSKVGDDFIDNMERYAGVVKETLKFAGDSFLKVTGTGIQNMGKKLQDIVNTRNIQTLVTGGAGAADLPEIIRGSQRQFGQSTRAFEDFKDSLLDQNKKANSYYDKSLFGAKDVTTYLGLMQQLNVRSNDYAKKNYEELITANKYLAQTAKSTQSVIDTETTYGTTGLLAQSNSIIGSLTGSGLALNSTSSNAVTSTTNELLQALSARYKNTDVKQQMNEGSATLAALSSNNDVFSAFTTFVQDVANMTETELMSKYAHTIQGRSGQISAMKTTGADISTLYDIWSSGLQKIYSSGMDTAYLQTGTSGDVISAVANSSDVFDSRLQQATKAIEDGGDKSFFKGLFLSVEETFTNLFGNTLAEVNWGTYVNLANAANIMVAGGGALKGLDKVSSLIRAGGWGGLSGKLTGTATAGGSSLAGLGVAAAGIYGVGSTVYDMYKGGISEGGGVAGAARYGFLGTGDRTKTTGENAMSVLGNAAKGAGIGLMFGPWGAAIGGVLGAGLGLIGTALKPLKNIEDNTKEQLDATKQQTSALSAYSKAYYSDSYAYRANTGAAGTGSGGKGGAYPWTVTSEYGAREPFYANGKLTSAFHSGIDFGAAKGTPIGASNSGVVKKVGYDSMSGNFISIIGDDGMTYRYSHMNEPSMLMAGQRVSAGTTVGYIGSTGAATGSHLDFSVYNANGKSVDPKGYITDALFNAKSSSAVTVSDLLSDTATSKAVASYYASKGAASADGTTSSAQLAKSSDIDRLIEAMRELSNKQKEDHEMLRALSKKNDNFVTY